MPLDSGMGAETMVLTRKIARGVVLAIALGLSLVLALGVWKGKTRQGERPAPESEATEAEMKLTDMEYTEMQAGRRLWTIKASEAKYFQGEQKTLLKSVLLTFFMEEGDEIRLESQQGMLYAGTKNIELWDSVHVMLPRGYELSTERAFYEHERETISSETLIRISGPDLKLKGGRWQYRIPEHKAVLEGGIEASLAFLPPKTDLKQ
jgi:LPS export ABC transporter protein LptC